MTGDGPLQISSQAAPDELVAVAEALERISGWTNCATPRGGPRGVALSVLTTIASAGPLRISDLAGRERISQPGMTHVVDRLVEAGLAERRTDRADGRIVLVAATPAGREHLAAQRSSRVDALVARLSLLPPRDRHALCASIDVLNDLSTSPTPEEAP
ncbi:MarR family winged helix-turn-helix transcriptional regulator [Streptomyces sp. NPDC020917]|uniref:MarR family winged helix-turn-helix transcriptional regulator n=1 Tax=Streptomyces sp. NPDC020917 TaxID=3365102 RepID=UPI0037A0AFD6